MTSLNDSPAALPADLDCDLWAELARLLRQIPAGRVTTYGLLAEALGDRSAARWVGEFLVDHPHSPQCPCHRVVRQDGRPGLYIAGDSEGKLARLRSEGVAIDAGRVVAPPFADFDSCAPLRRLKEFQLGVPGRLRLRGGSRRPRRVAALDVAYLSPREALVACVVADAATLAILDATTLRVPVTFPYIPGYLTFRELPAMLAAWQCCRTRGPQAELVLIDGNGILHPRRAGIAACFGLLADVPTIGVGKSLLCGRVDLEGLRSGEQRPVLHDGELIGMALKSTDASRPIFVSPGNHVDVPGAAQFVQRLFAGHRLPEPLHVADRLTKQTVRDCRAADGDRRVSRGIAGRGTTGA